MNIIDTYERIFDYFPSGTFCLENWESYARSISDSLVELVENDIKDYDYEKDILPIIEQLFLNKDKLSLLHDSFVKVTDGLSEKIEKIFHTSLNVDIVLYIGLCNGAGWATSLDGKPTVLLGMEKIIELNWYDEKNMIALIYHELGHIWHKQVRATETLIHSQREKALWQLYSEGFAMYFEQLLCGNPNFYHQDINGWLEWCNTNQKHLFSEYYKHVILNESVAAFFGDWHSFEGKSDVGYYLGAELMKTLAKKYEIYELANLKLSLIEDTLKELSS